MGDEVQGFVAVDTGPQGESRECTATNGQVVAEFLGNESHIFGDV